MKLKIVLIGWIIVILLLALFKVDAAASEQIDIIKEQSNPVVPEVVAKVAPELAPKASKPSRIKLGTFIITYYDADIACTGKTDGITNTGIKAKVGKTISVDPSIIPLGSKVYIEGLGYFVAEDTGGAIKENKIDVFVKTHKEANRLGKHKAEVYLIVEDAKANN